jgi:hypothetical protein
MPRRRVMRDANQLMELAHAAYVTDVLARTNTPDYDAVQVIP